MKPGTELQDLSAEPSTDMLSQIVGVELSKGAGDTRR